MQSSLSFAELRLFPLLICLDLAVLEDFVHFSIRIDVQVCLPVPEDPLQRSMPGSATFNEPQLVLCRTELRWPLLAAVPLKQRDTPSPRRMLEESEELAQARSRMQVQDHNRMRKIQRLQHRDD